MSAYVTAGRKTATTQYSPTFRPPHGKARAPVKGGRWFVRKMKYNPQGKVWRAWSVGKSRKYSKRFHTFQEAINWAQDHAGKP